MTHTRQKGSLSREHMARRGHSTRLGQTGRQDLIGRRQNSANAIGRSLPRHFLNELRATKEGVAQWNKDQSEKPKEEQEVLDRKQYPLRRRGGPLVGSQLAQKDNRAQVRRLVAQHRPKAKGSNVPVVRTSKAQVRNVPVVRCSKTQVGRLPVERTSKAHVRRLPVASSSKAQVAGLPVGSSSRGQVQSLHVAGPSKREVRRLLVRNDSRGQVRSLPVRNSSRVKVLGAPVQRQSKAQVSCLRVQQNCSKAQVRSCLREQVDSTPLQRSSKSQVGGLPARCSSRRKMDNGPLQKPSKAEIDSSPMTQSLKAEVKSLPVRCSSRRQVLGLPVRGSSRGKVDSLPMRDHTKAELDIPLGVSSAAKVDSAPVRCSPRGQVHSATPVGSSSAAQASGRGMGGQSQQVTRGRSSSKNFDKTNTALTNSVVTSNTKDSQPCTGPVQSNAIRSDSPDSQATSDSTSGSDTGRCTGLQSQLLHTGRSSAKTSQNADPAVTKPAANSDRRNSAHSKSCTGPAATARCPKEQSELVQRGRSSTNTRPTTTNLVDQGSAGGGKPSRTETAVNSDRRISSRYSSKTFDNTNTAVTHPAVTFKTRGIQPCTDPPLYSDSRYSGERSQALRRGRSSVKTSHATDATKQADNSDNCPSTAISKPRTDPAVTGRCTREQSEPIHRGRSSANTDPTATNPSDTSDRVDTGDCKPSRTETAVSSDSRTNAGSTDAVDIGKDTREQSQTLRRGRSAAKNSDRMDSAVIKAGVNSDGKNLAHSKPCTDSAVKSDSFTTPSSRERVCGKTSVVTPPAKKTVNSCPANTHEAQHQRRESLRWRNASPNGGKSDGVNTADMSDSKPCSVRTIAANTVRGKEQVASSCTGREGLQVASVVTRHAKQQLKSFSPQDSSSFPCQLKEQVTSSCTPRTKHRCQESSPSPPPSSTLSVPLQARKPTLQAKPKATPRSSTGPVVQHPKQASPRSKSASPCPSPGQLPHKRESRSPITLSTQHQKQGSSLSASPCTSPTQLPLLPRKGRLQQSRKSFPSASPDTQHQKQASSPPPLPLPACKYHSGTITAEHQNQNQECSPSPSPSPPPSASESSAQLLLPPLLPRKCRLASPNAELQVTTHPIAPGVQCQSQDHKHRLLLRQKSSPSPTPDPQHQKLEASPPSHPPSPQHPSVSVRVEHQKHKPSSSPSLSRSPSPPPLLLLPRKRRLASLNAEAVNSLLLELHPQAAKVAKKQLQDGPQGGPATPAATASSSPTTDCPVEPVSTGKPQPCQSHKQQQQHKEQHKLQQPQQKNQPHQQQQNQTQKQEQETLQQQQPLKRKPKPAEKQDFIDWNMFAPTPRRMAGLNAAALLRLTSSSAASSKQHAKPEPKSPLSAVDKALAKTRMHTAVAKRPHHHHQQQQQQREQQQQQRKRKSSAQRSSSSSSSSSAMAGPGSTDYRKGGFELSPRWEEEAVEGPHVAKAGYQQAGMVMEVAQYPLNQVKEEQVEEPISHTHCCCGPSPQGAPLDFCCHQLGIYIRQQHGYPEPQEGPFTAVRQQHGYPGEPQEGPFTPVKHECLVTSLPPHPSSLAHSSLAISSPHPCLCADHCFPSYYVHMPHSHPHPHHSFCPPLRAPCYNAITSYAYGALPHVNSRGCCFTSGCCRCRQHVKTEGYLSPPRHRDSRSPPSLPLSGCPLPRVTTPPPAPVPPHPSSPDTRHHHHQRQVGDLSMGGGGRVECPQGRKPSNGTLPGRRPPPSSKQPEVTVPPSGRQKKLARRRTTNGWRAVGKPVEREVFVVGEDEPVLRVCFEGVRRDGDLIGVRDTVLLRSGPRKKSDPYVAKISAIWEEPKTGELMMSLFWYYRPEHTQGGRDPNTHCQNEIFASKHQDVNSVACIEDKCYVLPLTQYCRYCALMKRRSEGVCVGPPLVPSPCDPPSPTPPHRCVPQDVDPELVYLCRHVYDFRYGRLLKNPQ